MENFQDWASELDIDAEREAEGAEDEVTLLRRQVADLSAKVGRLEPGGGKLPEEVLGLNEAIAAAQTPRELDEILIRSGLAGDEVNPYATTERW